MKISSRLLSVMLPMLCCLSAFAQRTVMTPAPAEWQQPAASAEAQAWFDAGQWRQGFKVSPFEQVDVQTFYEQYQKAPAMYDSIFHWLANIDPIHMEPNNRAMEWSHAYVRVINQQLKAAENCQWEQHRRTIDLQWDCTGSERYHMTHTPEALVPRNEYSEQRDVQNFGWDKTRPLNPAEMLVLDSDPETFYLFFPSDIHQATGVGRQVCVPRKIVVKIEYL